MTFEFFVHQNINVFLYFAFLSFFVDLLASRIKDRNVLMYVFSRSLINDMSHRPSDAALFNFFGGF